MAILERATQNASLFSLVCAEILRKTHVERPKLFIQGEHRQERFHVHLHKTECIVGKLSAELDQF